MSSSGILSNEECRSIIQACLKENDFNDVKVEIKPLEGAPAGFMSEHYRIRLQVEFPDNTVREFKFFAKTVPRKVPLHTAYVEDSGAYFKETYFYSKVMPGLQTHRVKDEGTANGDESFKNHRWAPQCFLTRPDIVVLQDLSVYNMKLFNSRELMDFKHCEVILREIADFHAATVILEEKQALISNKHCDINEIYPVVFDESITSSLSDDDSKGWFKAGVRSVLPLVDLLPKYKDNHEVRDLIRNKISEACKRLEILVGTSKKYRNVVCHGDLWANNILLQYNEEGEPQEARFVDFQLVRYTPPAHDVMCFLHLTTDRAFRDVHSDKLLSVYYNAFSTELHRNGLDPGTLLSWAEFKESCIYLRELAVITALLYFQMTLMKGEIIASIISDPEAFDRFMLVDRSVEVCASFQTDQVYRDRLNEAMEELIDVYILNRK
ncbi:uncharacterized protein [Anabrus simplex]|uniref:uncharacterized protein n=1 Tax=Anabrus simplex TaxID=316456 RepID=UPI0035A2E3F6